MPIIIWILIGEDRWFRLSSFLRPPLPWAAFLLQAAADSFDACHE